MRLGAIQAALVGLLKALGLLDADGQPTGGATPDLAAVLAEGNSATGPVLLGRGTAAAPVVAVSPDGRTGLYNAQTGGEDVSLSVGGVQAFLVWRPTGSICQWNTSAGNLQIAAGGNAGAFISSGGVFWLGSQTVMLGRGAGDPEGVVTAPVGSLFLRTDGGAGTTLYVKESGSGNTGWVAK